MESVLNVLEIIELFHEICVDEVWKTVSWPAFELGTRLRIYRDAIMLDKLKVAERLICACANSGLTSYDKQITRPMEHMMSADKCAYNGISKGPEIVSISSTFNANARLIYLLLYLSS